VRDALTRKSITPEQELQDAVEEMARDIALIEPDPEDWGWWVGYLLEKLMDQAEKRRMLNQIQQALLELADNLQNHKEGRK
jgi:hypothetical protein